MVTNKLISQKVFFQQSFTWQ